MNTQYKQYSCLVTWIEKEKTHSLLTNDVYAARKAAKAISNDTKDECYCIIRDSNCGIRWNVSQTIVYRSGLEV